MNNLTLKQLFGDGSTQDINTLTIQKSSLSIIPSANNTAESLVVAILLKAIQAFRGSVTDVGGNLLKDINGNSITYDQTSLYELLDVFLWQVKIQDYYLIHQIVQLENQPYVD